MLAALSSGGLVPLIIQIAVAGLIFWLLWFALNKINPPEPFRKVIEVILIVAAVVYLITLLLRVTGVSL